MSRYLPVNPSVDDIARVIKDLQRSVDGLVAGKLTINRDLDMRGYRVVNMGAPIDKSDGQTKIGEGDEQYAPLTAAYVVAGTLATDLPNERLLSGSSSITVTDNGAGSTVSIAATQSFFDALYQPLDAQLTSLAALSYTGNTLKVVRVNAGETGFELASPGSGGIGTVTSVDVSGGTTGLTFSGGPITTSGTITMSGTLAAANGGMVYPGAGIANSTGSAWGTSYTTTGSGTVVALQTSPSLVTPDIGVATGTSVDLSGHAAIGGTSAVASDRILHLNEAFNTSSQQYGLLIDGTSAGTGNIAGIVTDFEVTGTSGKTSVRGLDAEFNLSGSASQTYTQADGINVRAYHGTGAGTTTATSLNGAFISTETSGTGRITTTQRGILIDNTIGAGTSVTTNIGLRINAVSGATNNWSIQAAGGQSYHVGNLRIGSTTAPTVALDVTGAATISSTVKLSALTTNGVVTTSGGDGTLGSTATPSLTSLTLSSLTSGRVTFAGTSGLLDDDADFLWDDTNKRLGVGITPTNSLHVYNASAAPVRFSRLNTLGSSLSAVLLLQNTSTTTSTGASVTMVHPDTGGTARNTAYVGSELTASTASTVTGNLVFGTTNAGTTPSERWRMTATALHPVTDAASDIGTSALGVAGVYFGDGGGDTARIVAPALSADITLTLPAATGTLATLAGTETLTNKSIGSDLLPSADSAYDLGSLSSFYAEAYIDTLVTQVFTSRATGLAGDVNSSAGYSEVSQAKTLANGANNNIALGAGWWYVTGPTGAFSITGIAAPTGNQPDGYRLTIYNATTQNMTIARESASSTAANRIETMTGGDVTGTGLQVVTLIYSVTASRWLLVSTQG